MLTFRQLQEEVGVWNRRNFGDQPTYRMILGAIEEMGELAHAHLKEEQAIRGTPEQHQADAKDAVGDVVIYLTDYCARRGWDFQEIMETVWARVKARDWKKDPTKGGESV